MRPSYLTNVYECRCRGIRLWATRTAHEDKGLNIPERGDKLTCSKAYEAVRARIRGYSYGRRNVWG